MKELRKAWRTVKGPVWATYNSFNAAMKTDVMNKWADRKRRSKLGRRALVYLQRAHAVGWGVVAFWAVLGGLVLLMPFLPITAALLMTHARWAGAGDVE